eukprot:357423-Chlamydomonas_euryale.AAC.5
MAASVTLPTSRAASQRKLRGRWKATRNITGLRGSTDDVDALLPRTAKTRCAAATLPPHTSTSRTSASTHASRKLAATRGTNALCGSDRVRARARITARSRPQSTTSAMLDSRTYRQARVRARSTERQALLHTSSEAGYGPGGIHTARPSGMLGCGVEQGLPVLFAAPFPSAEACYSQHLSLPSPQPLSVPIQPLSVPIQPLSVPIQPLSVPTQPLSVPIQPLSVPIQPLS